MRPRANTLGLLFHKGHLLLEEQEGTHSQGTGLFYRPIGGTIELGEPSALTLVREYHEELGADIEIHRYVSCLENIYEIHGDVFHEITQLYTVGFKDPALYLQKAFTVTEGLKTTTAKWIPLTQLRNSDTVLYPAGLLELIEREIEKGVGG
ncbi:NUDIX hydrolase [Planomicrobium sp. CPCC 101079]|uniref:NUDIX hydrolase n=1 Tax=Planomicrobium sp. CPCC 101079 TaxID=2599618 RepID=UPI0011B564DB|nr:NUDIX domain-containing protein [Planomicrobium sp. CPCC 101079]TWT09327.1 NUDIX domain-containing protein [Planomicrobium sp. CPCC 101079]